MFKNYNWVAFVSLVIILIIGYKDIGEIWSDSMGLIPILIVVGVVLAVGWVIAKISDAQDRRRSQRIDLATKHFQEALKEIDRSEVVALERLVVNLRIEFKGRVKMYTSNMNRDPVRAAHWHKKLKDIDDVMNVRRRSLIYKHDRMRKIIASDYKNRLAELGAL